MGFAMHHGVLFYEAMGLNFLIGDFCFGVFFYEATRTPEMHDEIESCGEDNLTTEYNHNESRFIFHFLTIYRCAGDTHIV